MAIVDAGDQLEGRYIFIILFQIEDDGDMYQERATRDGEENTDSVDILKVGWAALADWLCGMVKGR